MDLSKYLGLFVSEGGEHAEQMARELLQLEGAAVAPEAIDSIFRHAHSIKGMAASMEFSEITELAHAAESLVGALRPPRAGSVPRATVDALMAAAERIAVLIRERGRGQQGEGKDLTLLLRGRAADPWSEPVAEAIPLKVEPAVSLRDRLRTVRVRGETLDELLDVAGELLLETSRLRELARQAREPLRAALDESVDRMHSRLRTLHQRVVAARLTPLSVLTDQLPRHLRDIAHQLGREVELSVAGAEVEVDRAIVDEIADALLHLLRNCIDHGIEPPAEREAAGKPRAGRLRVEARRERERLILEVADDGRGFDTKKLRAGAVRRGLLSIAAAEELSDQESLMLACLPGLSTSDRVTEISGRGVGMDAVKNAIEGLGGTLAIESTPLEGTRFVLRLPLNVALIQVLLAEVEREVIALPISKVLAAIEIPSGHGRTFEFQGDEAPVYSLGSLLEWKEIAAGSAAGRPVLVVDGGGKPVGLAVDRIVGQHEALLQPLAGPLGQFPGLSAVTLLGSGRPVFVLDVPRLLEA